MPLLASKRPATMPCFFDGVSRIRTAYGSAKAAPPQRAMTGNAIPRSQIDVVKVPTMSPIPKMKRARFSTCAGPSRSPSLPAMTAPTTVPRATTTIAPAVKLMLLPRPSVSQRTTKLFIPPRASVRSALPTTKSEIARSPLRSPQRSANGELARDSGRLAGAPPRGIITATIAVARRRSPAPTRYGSGRQSSREKPAADERDAEACAGEHALDALRACRGLGRNEIRIERAVRRVVGEVREVEEEHLDRHHPDRPGERQERERERRARRRAQHEGQPFSRAGSPSGRRDARSTRARARR